MGDLEEYLARRYCAHMHEIAEKSNTSFSRRMFEVDAAEPNSFEALAGYRVKFEDEGSYMRVTFNGRQRDISVLKKKVGKLNVPSKYRKILSSLKVGEKENKLYVDANFVPIGNADGRSQNEDKIYFSIRNAVVKPVFKVIMEGEK
jgi:hypothetical protein